MTKDSMIFVTFANHISILSVILTAYFPLRMKAQHKLAAKLLADIKKEYDLE
jgi:hypothetical protein